jgi:cbb3-type cytochrome oxidase subunit 1
MGVKYFKISVVYFIIAIILGIYMGIIDNFDLASVHAHLNLLGWVSMALFGAIYHFYPQAGETKLAKTHFWLHNLGVPIMQAGIAYSIVTENEWLTVVVIVASLAIVLGGILFMVNLFKNI